MTTKRGPGRPQKAVVSAEAEWKRTWREKTKKKKNKRRIQVQTATQIYRQNQLTSDDSLSTTSWTDIDDLFSTMTVDEDTRLTVKVPKVTQPGQLSPGTIQTLKESRARSTQLRLAGASVTEKGIAANKELIKAGIEANTELTRTDLLETAKERAEERAFSRMIAANNGVTEQEDEPYHDDPSRALSDKSNKARGRPSKKAATKKPPTTGKKSTRKACVVPSRPSPKSLADGSNKIALSTHFLGKIPSKFKDMVAETYSDEEIEARIGAELQTYRGECDFGHLAEFVKSHMIQHANTKHEYFLLESNNTIMHAEQPLDIPVLRLIIVPQGTKLPPLVQDGHTSIFYSFDELRLGKKRVKDLVKNYSTTGRQKEDPVTLVDKYLEGRLFVLVGAGPTRRGCTMEVSEVSRYSDLNLVDCRPGKTFQEKHLTKAPISRNCGFAFEINGTLYKYRKDANESEDDAVEDFLECEKGVEDSAENREIIRRALRQTLDSKNGSIVKALEMLGRKCETLEDFNKIKLALIGPSNLKEVVKQGVRQLFMTEAYKDFVRRQFGDECDVRQLALRHPKEVLAEHGLSPESLLDQFISHRSEVALSCLSDDLSKYSQRLPDWDYGDDRLPRPEFTLDSVLRRTEGDIDVELTRSTAYKCAERFLKAKKKKDGFTIGEKLALHEFASVCTLGIDPATVTFTLDKLKDRILLPYHLEPEDHTFVATGAAYGPPISINMEGGAINDGSQEEVEPAARQS